MADHARMGISAKVIFLNKSLNGEKTMTLGMKTDTYILAEAMRILSESIESDDGIANAAILEASHRLVELAGDNLHLQVQNNKLKSDIDRLKS